MHLPARHRNLPLTTRVLAARLALQPVPSNWPEAFADAQAQAMAEGDWSGTLSDYACVRTDRMTALLDLCK